MKVAGVVFGYGEWQEASALLREDYLLLVGALAEYERREVERAARKG